MALFHILSPIQRLSQEDLPDQKKIESEWAASKDSYAKRKQIAEQLQFPDPNQDSLLEARRLTGAEIATARELKVSEADVLIDLEKTEHSQKIRKVHKLEACLGYVKSRAEQLFHLLMMWKDTLEKQEFLLDYLVSGSRNEIVKEKFLLLKRILPHHEQMEQLLSSAFDIPQAGLQLVDLPDFLRMLGLFQINKDICFRNLQLTCGSDFSACKPPGFEKAILIRVRELQLLGDLLSFCIGILAGCPFALNFLLVRQIFLAQALDWREDMKEGHCPAVPFYYNNLAVGYHRASRNL